MITIDPTEIPKDIDYQWGTTAVCGDASLGNIGGLRKNGWSEVPITRHPKLAKKSVSPHFIEAGSLLLMERPKYLTERAKHWEQQKADYQVVSALANMAAVGEAFGGRSVNARPLDWNASPIRKRTIKEFLVLYAWKAKVWARNVIARWRN